MDKVGVGLCWFGEEDLLYRLTLSGWCPCVSFPLQVRIHENNPCSVRTQHALRYLEGCNFNFWCLAHRKCPLPYWGASTGHFQTHATCCSNMSCKRQAANPKFPYQLSFPQEVEHAFLRPCHNSEDSYFHLFTCNLFIFKANSNTEYMLIKLSTKKIFSICLLLFKKTKYLENLIFFTN